MSADLASWNWKQGPDRQNNQERVARNNSLQDLELAQYEKDSSLFFSFWHTIDHSNKSVAQPFVTSILQTQASFPPFSYHTEAFICENFTVWKKTDFTSLNVRLCTRLIVFNSPSWMGPKSQVSANTWHVVRRWAEKRVLGQFWKLKLHECMSLRSPLPPTPSLLRHRTWS